MPIKLPKGFQRRKSSGNALDEVQDSTDSPSSFRVLARPHSNSKSFEKSSGIQSTTGKPLPPIKLNFENEDEDLFPVGRPDAANRSSNGTSHSVSNAHYDSATSSSRLSSSSTNPSSVDTRSDRNIKSAVQRSYDDVPAPPPHSQRGGFLKNAGRTFSLGLTRNHGREPSDMSAIPLDRSRPQTVQAARDRALTTSTTTTETPPQLDSQTFPLKSSGDFSSMFTHLATKSSKENLEQSASWRPSILTSSSQSGVANKAANVESSSPTWTSKNSRDGLGKISSLSKPATQLNAQPPSIQSLHPQYDLAETTFEDNMFEELSIRRSPEALTTKAQLSSPSRPPTSSFHSDTRDRTRTLSNTARSQITRQESSDETTPLDPGLMASARLATQYEENRPSAVKAEPNKKVMTPAQFERYKQQKEDTRLYNKVFGRANSDDGSGDDYEDEDDDQERERRAAKQRKKQEAHLAVYRQQMMKMTGDATTLPTRPITSAGPFQLANSSQPDLSRMDRRLSHLTLNETGSMLGAVNAPTDEGEEDEDVPLGILAAHGFPNKNRPPTRLAAASSNPNLRNLVPNPGSTPPVTSGGDPNRNSLPAFARNLPVDPYYGAGLVQQSERSPMAMHASSSQIQLVSQPQPSGAATSHPLHPAGLVGVIAGEERARAMRRGSPNAQGNYDVPPMSTPQRNSQLMPGYPGMPMMPQQPMTQAEQAQLQMSHSMQQMMQMQMQWMQQMSSMMGQQPNMPMFQGMPMPQINVAPSPGTPSINGQPLSRPQSVPLQNYSAPDSRTMSMLSPNMAGWNHSSPAVPQLHPNGSVYAPSIAPSERSNVGLAPRYRPVSTMSAVPEPTSRWQKRASTFTSLTSRNWQNENANSRTTIRNIHPGDEDDEEEGWAAMKARKDQKQKSWKLRKGGSNTLQELYNTPA